MREIIIVGRFCRTRVSSNGKLRTEKALLRVGRAWGCEGLRGRNKGKRQNETVQRYSPCRRLPVGFAEVKSSDFHRRERLRPRWEGLRGAIRFVLCPGKGSVFSDCRPFYWNCTPRPKAGTPHPSCLTAICLPLQREGLAGALRRTARSPARRFADSSPPRVPLRPPPAAPRVRPRAASLIPRRPASRSDH